MALSFKNSSRSEVFVNYDLAQHTGEGNDKHSHLRCRVA